MTDASLQTHPDSYMANDDNAQNVEMEYYHGIAFPTIKLGKIHHSSEKASPPFALPVLLRTGPSTTRHTRHSIYKRH